MIACFHLIVFHYFFLYISLGSWYCSILWFFFHHLFFSHEIGTFHTFLMYFCYILGTLFGVFNFFVVSLFLFTLLSKWYYAWFHYSEGGRTWENGVNKWGRLKFYAVVNFIQRINLYPGVKECHLSKVLMSSRIIRDKEKLCMGK